MKSGNLKFLEPSGQLQACNETALPLLLLLLLLLLLFNERKYNFIIVLQNLKARGKKKRESCPYPFLCLPSVFVSEALSFYM